MKNKFLQFIVGLSLLTLATACEGVKTHKTDAFMYNKIGQYDKAMASIEKCINHEKFLDMKPDDQSTAWLYRAAIYWNVIQSNDSSLLAQAPDALEFVYESIIKCMENKNFLEQYEQEIYTRAAAVMIAYYQQGVDYYNTGMFAEAVPMFKKAYDIASIMGDSNADDMLDLVAFSFFRSEDYITALEYFNELKNNGGETAEVYKHLAGCYKRIGAEKQALDMIIIGLEKYPDNANLILEKVNAYLEEGKGTEAIVDLEKLFELDPNNAKLLFVLGTIYGDENNTDVYDSDKALHYYNQALTIDPDYYDAAYNIGALYITMANKYIEEANEITGSSKAENAKYDGLIEKANEQFRSSLPYLQCVYENQPSDDVKYVLRSIYVKLNMTKEVKALDEQ